MSNFNPTTDAAELQVKSPFSQEKYTSEEIEVLKAKGWHEFSGTCAYGDFYKLVKQVNKYVLFSYIEDDEGGYWDEWSDSVYTNINDVREVT